MTGLQDMAFHRATYSATTKVRKRAEEKFPRSLLFFSFSFFLFVVVVVVVVKKLRFVNVMYLHCSQRTLSVAEQIEKAKTNAKKAFDAGLYSFAFAG